MGTEVVVVPGDGASDAAVGAVAGAAAVTAEHAEETAAEAAETAAEAAVTADVAVEVAQDVASMLGDLRAFVEDGFAELRGMIADSRIEAQVVAEETAAAQIDVVADELTPPAADPDPEPDPAPAPPKKQRSKFGSDGWFGDRR